MITFLKSTFPYLILVTFPKLKFKKVSTNFFWSKIGKSGQMKFILFTFLFIFLFLKWYLNLGKFKKLNFRIKDQKLYAFSQNWNSVSAKKTECYFFLLGGSTTFVGKIETFQMWLAGPKDCVEERCPIPFSSKEYFVEGTYYKTNDLCFPNVSIDLGMNRVHGKGCQGSISPTFYIQIFCTSVVSAAFLCTCN